MIEGSKSIFPRYDPMHRYLLSSLIGLTFPASVWAGMPTITLTDMAKMRLESISFFLFCFFGSAFLIQRLWNYLRKDFTFLPRLNYWRSVGVVTVWGLIFIVVLTMISGARELMTPGAWKRDGVTYKLDDSKPPEIKQTTPSDSERRLKLQTLYHSLRAYVEKNGKFPSSREDKSIPPDLWDLPGSSTGFHYFYLPPESTNATRPIAFEPEVFGNHRFVLFGDGQVWKMESEELERILQSGGEK
jgi:hypothetical protein